MEGRAPLRMAGPLALNLTASGAVQGLNAVTGIVLARSLGPQDRGLLAAAILWPVVLAAVGHLGVSEAATYEAARRRVSAGALVGTSVALALMQSAVLIAAGLLVVPLALGSHGSDVVRVSYLYLAFIPLHLTTLHLIGVLNGHHRFLASSTIRSVYPAVSTAGIAGLAAAGILVPVNVVAVYLAAGLVTAAVASVAVFGRGLRPTVSLPVARQLLGFGVRSHTGALSGFANDRLGQLAISVFLAPAQLGLYVVAVTFTSLTYLVSSSFSAVTFPIVAQLDGAERRRAAIRLVATCLLASAIVTVPLLVFTPAAIELAFGEEFSGAAAAARILLVAGVVLALGRVLASVLRAVGRPLQVGVAETAALAVTCLGLAVLLPAFGIVGAAVAALAAYATGCAWSLLQASRALGVSLRPAGRPAPLAVAGER